MNDLYEHLTENLKGVRRLVVLGVGSFLKSDDAAGVIITERLKERFKCAGLSSVSIFTGEIAPENFTGTIKKSKPDHILVLDAADLKKEPGSIKLITLDMINTASFSTHMLPIKIMLDYLICETGCNITIIGIQPESLEFACKVTKRVDETIDYVTSVIEKIIVQLEIKNQPY